VAVVAGRWAVAPQRTGQEVPSGPESALSAVDPVAGAGRPADNCRRANDCPVCTNARADSRRANHPPRSINFRSGARRSVPRRGVRGSALCSHFRRFFGSGMPASGLLRVVLRADRALAQAFLLHGLPQGFRTRPRTGSTLSSSSAGRVSAASPTFASRAEAAKMMSAVIAENPSAFLSSSYPPRRRQRAGRFTGPPSFFKGWGFEEGTRCAIGTMPRRGRCP